MRLRTLFTVLALVWSLLAFKSEASGFSDESLNYVITYKWGLIHKDAGDARLTLANKGDFYEAVLTGKTLPWADKFFQVRDTLKAVIKKEGLKPVSYTKIAHEDGKYSFDELKYSYAGSTVGVSAHRVRVKKGERTESEKSFTAGSPAFDMLSVFYFLRTVDYARLTSGKTLHASVFSGSKVEDLTIKCVGKEKIKLRDKSTREAYHIRFRFTTQGQKKSSDDLDAWISTDSRHIPLQITGSLPVGQVRCYFTGTDY